MLNIQIVVWSNVSKGFSVVPYTKHQWAWETSILGLSKCIEIVSFCMKILHYAGSYFFVKGWYSYCIRYILENIQLKFSQCIAHNPRICSCLSCLDLLFWWNKDQCLYNGLQLASGTILNSIKQDTLHHRCHNQIIKLACTLSCTNMVLTTIYLTNMAWV